MLDSRRGVYSKFIVAMRRYITYATGPAPSISAVSYPEGVRPVFEGEAAEFKDAIEATYGELQLAAGQQETVSQAHKLARAARRIAVASATKDEKMYDKLLKYWALERQFVNTVRAELGHQTVLVNPYDPAADLP